MLFMIEESSFNHLMHMEIVTLIGEIVIKIFVTKIKMLKKKVKNITV